MGIQRARRSVWAAAVANIAAIVLLLRAVLLPFGCFAEAAEAGPPADAPLLSAICSFHGLAQPGDPDTQGGANDQTPHTSLACASGACCPAAVPVAGAVVEVPPAYPPVFTVDRWQRPAEAINLALRNRGPPLSPSA